MGIFRKVSGWYFTQKALPYWCILVLDCAIVGVSGYIGYYFNLGGIGFASSFWPITWALLIGEFFFVATFKLFHTYSGVIRYSSFVDLQRVATATIIATAGFYIAGILADLIWPGQRAVLFPDFITVLALFVISTLVLWVERIVVKRLHDEFLTDNAKPTVIYGTQEGGISLAKSITSVKDKKFVLHSFITDGLDMKGAYMMGKPVYYNEPGLARKLKAQGIKVLLVSPLKSDRFRENVQMVDEFIDAGIQIMMMPPAEEWDGKDYTLSHRQLHEVDVEDLLPRDKIEVDMDAIGALLAGKCILITGAAGSIGSEMVRQVARFKPSRMILIDQAETPMHDIRLMMSRKYSDIDNLTIVTSIANKRHMEKIFAEYRPEYVFHAAAYKHVPMMEDDPAIAVQNNIYGTRVIADLAVKYGTKKFVMISTDKAVNPTNVMGCSKRI